MLHEKMYSRRLMVSLFLFTLIFIPMYGVNAAFQTDLNTQTGAFAGSGGANLVAPKDPRIVAANLVKSALTMIGALFLAYTVYAGYMILTSSGEEDKVNKGKETLKRAVIGVLISLSAYAITAFIANQLLYTTSSAVIQLEMGPSAQDQRRYDNPDPLATPAYQP